MLFTYEHSWFYSKSQSFALVSKLIYVKLTIVSSKRVSVTGTHFSFDPQNYMEQSEFVTRSYFSRPSLSQQSKESINFRLFISGKYDIKKSFLKMSFNLKM